MSEFEGMAEIAEHAIRRFAGDVDRGTAGQAARFWFGWEFLSRQSRDEVLARFPEPAERVLNEEFYAGAVA